MLSEVIREATPGMVEIDLLPPSSKHELLLLIKRRGTITLSDAVEALTLARTTLREHLSQLERDGLVKRFTRKQARGRPSLHYRLTERGERLFPLQDGVLLGTLLDFLQRENRQDLIDAFFEWFWDARVRDLEDRFSVLDPEDRAGRLEVLESVLWQQGFMPEISYRGEVLVIRQCNCPFPEAVKQTCLPCWREAKFYERIFASPIERVSYIPDGDPACTYEIPAWKEDTAQET